MDERRTQRRDDLRRRLADAPEGTLALLYELMDAAHGDFETTTRSLFRQLCDESGIAFEHSELGTLSDPPTPIERPPSPTPGQIRAMTNAAIEHYERNLRTSVLHLWRDKAVNIRQMDWVADRQYDKMLGKVYLDKMEKVLRKRQENNFELEHRLDLFDGWVERRIVERSLRAWILRHRENSLHKFQRELAAQTQIQKWRSKTATIQQQEMRADDARDFMAASSALTAWRTKARHLRGIRQFKELYLRLKWFKIWKAKTKASSRARYDALLKDRYREAKRRLGMRSARRFLEVWRDKTAQITENERKADDFFTRNQAERVRQTAHTALTTMYTSTAETLQNEQSADAHYEHNLVNRLSLLEPSGPWRTKLHTIQQMDAKADEYREIKTQEVARDALRTIRNQASRSRQMEAQADEFYERHGRRKAQGYMQVWRGKMAEKTGVGLDDRGVIPVLPATPAARRGALFRNVGQ